jgi:hypothetical protein
MNDSNAPLLSREVAHATLKQFDCLKLTEAFDADLVRRSLLWVAEQSDYQMLGICADSLEQGVATLAAYAEALGYQPNLALAPVAEEAAGVYIKFNPNSDGCYASAYEGEHRGVLVSCQSAFEDGVNEMYGHLPLDLFG